MPKKVGVILSGSGVFDGSEIHEATLVLYFLSKAGAEYVCLAPNKPQMDVVDHVAGRPSQGETRNVLVEAARIARGKVQDVATARAVDLDAVIFPGGFGAAKNLSTFAAAGANCDVDDGVARLVREMHRAKKPIGALCIAPVILARLLGPDAHVEVTIGSDRETAAAVEKMGAKHRVTATTDICVDAGNRVVTTPCYMTAKNIAEVGAGAEKLVEQVLNLS